jgi:hypothetical protein
MRAPTTPLATGDAPAPPRGGLSPGMLIAAKAVLGIVGLAGCVLVGAGGAWLVKHFLMSDPHAGAMAAQALPTTRTPPAAAPAAASVAAVTAAAPPAQALATPADVPTAAIEAAPPAAGLPAPVNAAIDAPPPSAQAVPYPATTPPLPVKPAHAVVADGHAATARADKARCLATVNAITADLSLRNEPPTPEQLAILKRGCK